MDALDVEKQERISHSRDAASKRAVRIMRDKLQRVSEQDTVHQKMFSSLQASAVRKKLSDQAEERRRAEEMRLKIAETKEKLLHQREKYKEQIDADGEVERFIHQRRAAAQRESIKSALTSLLDGCTAGTAQTPA